MSGFGAIPVDMNRGGIDYLVSSSNKNIEGVPGFAFCIARRTELEKCKGNARSVSLDLQANGAGLSANGQFRFTPPCHTLIAFQQAMYELQQEGGVRAREARYKENKRIVVEGYQKLGFNLYLEDEHASHIITSFRYPDSPNWDFPTFYEKLSERRCVLYPGKVSNADCFRVGHIGALHPKDSEFLVRQTEEVLAEMDIVQTT